jgi:hypothetical protein
MSLKTALSGVAGFVRDYDNGEEGDVEDAVAFMGDLVEEIERAEARVEDESMLDGLTALLLSILFDEGDMPVALTPSTYGGAKGFESVNWVDTCDAHPLRDGEGHRGYDGEWQPGNGTDEDDRTIVVIGR